MSRAYAVFCSSRHKPTQVLRYCESEANARTLVRALREREARIQQVREDVYRTLEQQHALWSQMSPAWEEIMLGRRDRCIREMVANCLLHGAEQARCDVRQRYHQVEYHCDSVGI